LNLSGNLWLAGHAFHSGGANTANAQPGAQDDQACADGSTQVHRTNGSNGSFLSGSFSASWVWLREHNVRCQCDH
jgi:hypothetical protein